MACRLAGAKPLPEPMLAYCQLDTWEQISVKLELEFYHFHSRKCIWKCHLPKWQPFCPGGDELITTHSILWNTINYPCLRYLLLSPKFSYNLYHTYTHTYTYITYIISYHIPLCVGHVLPVFLPTILWLGNCHCHNTMNIVQFIPGVFLFPTPWMAAVMASAREA